MPRSEKAILNDTLVALSAMPETMVWRNNSGSAWQGQRIEVRPGQMLRMEPGMVILREARPVTFGLPGSSDIIGVSGGMAIAPEVKTAGGRLSDPQRRFAAAFERAGGLHLVVRDPAAAVAEIRRRLESRALMALSIKT